MQWAELSLSFAFILRETRKTRNWGSLFLFIAKRRNNLFYVIYLYQQTLSCIVKIKWLSMCIIYREIVDSSIETVDNHFLFIAWKIYILLSYNTFFVNSAVPIFRYMLIPKGLEWCPQVTTCSGKRCERPTLRTSVILICIGSYYSTWTELLLAIAEGSISFFWDEKRNYVLEICFGLFGDFCTHESWMALQRWSFSNIFKPPRESDFSSIQCSSEKYLISF